MFAESQQFPTFPTRLPAAPVLASAAEVSQSVFGLASLLLVQQRSGWRLSWREGALLMVLPIGYSLFLAMR